MSTKNSYSQQLREEFTNFIDTLELNDRQKHYLKSRWLDQVLWMEGKANQSRERYYQLRLISIIGGLIVPILVSLNIDTKPLDSYVKAVTIALSGVVAVSTSIEEFFHYGERWRHYRRTTETLKAEGWQLFELSGSYGNYKTHEEAFKNFAGNVEAIIQSDVEVYVTKVTEENKKKEEEKQSET